MPQLINDVTQAIIQVSDFAYYSRQNIRSIFFDDVNDYFSSRKKDFSILRGMSMQGQSQLKYNIDFIFNVTIDNRKFADVYNGLSNALVEKSIGIWADTVDYRNLNGQEEIPYSIIVPSIPDNQQKYVDNLARHDITVIPFDDKDRVFGELAIRP